MDAKTRIVVERLQRITSRWGGKLIVVSWGAFCELMNDRGLIELAPAATGLGLNWKDKLIFVAREHVNPGAIIHEMGHVFADREWPSNNEFDWLGWEICLARKAGCYRAWDKQNAGHGVFDVGITGIEDNEWGYLTRPERQRITRDRIAYGIKTKIIDKNHSPLAIR